MMEPWAFFEDGYPHNDKNNNKMISDMRSVPDLTMDNSGDLTVK